MSARLNQVLCLLHCVVWLENELRRSEPEAQHWVRATLEAARRVADTAFEALRSAARRGDPNAQVALDGLVASLAINDAHKSLASRVVSEGT
jgi:hypothetical protein